MPQQQSYKVTFPDGYVQTFQGPSGMSDDDVVTRAKQERDVASGRIQTTFAGGAAKALGEDPKTTGALLSGLSLIPGAGGPLAAAASPLMAKAIQYGTQQATGQKPQSPDLAEMTSLAGQSALSALPFGVNRIAGGMAAKVVPHQLPSGQWVKGLTGSGVVPWAVREGSLAAGQVANNPLVQGASRYAPTLRDAILSLLGPRQQSGSVEP